jgi:hypothetical protein
VAPACAILSDNPEGPREVVKIVWCNPLFLCPSVGMNDDYTFSDNEMLMRGFIEGESSLASFFARYKIRTGERPTTRF